MRTPFKKHYVGWIGALSGAGGGGAMSYDSQIQNYFTGLSTAGGSLSTAHKNALQTLKNTLGNIGGVNEWLNIKELWICKGGNLNAALVKTVYQTGYPANLTGTNLVSGDYSEGSGIRGNGSNKSIDTGTSYKALLDPNNFHLLYIGDHLLQESGPFNSPIGGGAAGWEFGTTMVQNGSAMGWQSLFGGDANAGKFFWTELNEINRGIHLLNTNSSTLGTAYLDKPSLSGTNTNARVAWSQTSNITLLARNGTTWPSNAAMNLYSVGTAFTPANVPAIYAAFKTFQTAIGRGHGSNIVQHGDSLTTSGPWGTRCIKALDNNFTLSNYGHPGWGITAVSSGILYLPAVSGELDADLNSNGIYCYAGGTNDLGFGTNQATIVANMTSRLIDNINYVKARGVTKIVIMTVAARAYSTSTFPWDTTKEANRVSYNNWVINNASTYGYVVADVGNSVHLGDPNNVDTTTNGYYNADGLHWNENGHIYAGGIFATAITNAGF